VGAPAADGAFPALDFEAGWTGILLPAAAHQIPAFAAQLDARRDAGATWAELAEWVHVETGMEVAPSTIYRWHQHLQAAA
jgi:hypothetical protein